MSASLCGPVSERFRSAAVGKLIFGERERNTLLTIYEPREQPDLSIPSESCNTNLFFGFFFDGTNNSYADAEPLNCMSNVARLYDCFPGRSVPGVLPARAEWTHKPLEYMNFFKVYAPGVGTRFAQVGDSGEGMDKTAGAAFGAMGERRIIWALAQAINNVHRYFYKAPLIDPSEMQSLVRRVFLNKYSLAAMAGQSTYARKETEREADQAATNEFKEILSRLHFAVRQHWTDERTGCPAKVDPGIVKTIYVSIFGFSRGATQARAFANWLQALCRLDSRLRGKPGGLSLGGFKVEFDFLGVFDTVASVGAASSSRFFHGHGAWADSEVSLRVPAGVKCVHLVAAHEVRRSFPVDSISVGGVLPVGCSEIVVPGVHSDIGGGYCPGEQGRGIDKKGDDMLSRIPLLMMYKAARLNGVPLKLEFAAPVAKERFALRMETILAFNAYIATCKQTSGTLHSILREQGRKQMEWRLHRRIHSPSPLQKTGSFLRSSTYDQNDLHSAASEFEDEIKSFEAWLRDKDGFRMPGQHTLLGADHLAEWEEIATWWKPLAVPAPEVMRFFDEYVHDSRAWFKLPGPDNEAEMHERLRKWSERRRVAREFDRAGSAQSLPRLVGKADFRVVPARSGMMTDEECRAADEYTKTGTIPRMYIGGRENFTLMGAGYLRFRRVYAGSDSALMASVGATQPSEQNVA